MLEAHAPPDALMALVGPGPAQMFVPAGGADPGVAAHDARHRQLTLKADQLKVQDLVVVDLGLGAHLAVAGARQHAGKVIREVFNKLEGSGMEGIGRGVGTEMGEEWGRRRGEVGSVEWTKEGGTWSWGGGGGVII